jgi:hypothetical protein
MALMAIFRLVYNAPLIDVPLRKTTFPLAMGIIALVVSIRLV